MPTIVGDWIETPLRMPPGHCEIVVGDVHGCREQLEAVLEAACAVAPDAHLTLLGDLADRGPDSVGAIRAASDAIKAWRLRGLDVVLLPGNHEQMRLGTALDTGSHHGDILLRHGGLWLYDLCVPQGGRGRFDPPTVRAHLRAALGEAARAMLTQGGAMLGESNAAPVLHRRVGNVVLVHAGLHPQAAEPETWIEASDPMGIDDDHPLVNPRAVPGAPGCVRGRPVRGARPHARAPDGAPRREQGGAGRAPPRRLAPRARRRLVGDRHRIGGHITCHGPKAEAQA